MHPKTRDAVFSGHFRGWAVVSAPRELTAGDFCGMMEEAGLRPERPLPARAARPEAGVWGRSPQRQGQRRGVAGTRFRDIEGRDRR